MPRNAPRWIAAAVIAAATSLLGTCAAKRALGEEAAQNDPSREELFTEGRWLMDTADARRWQKFRMAPTPEVRSLRDGTMPEFLQSIQRGLGGPLIDRFERLSPPSPETTPWWKQFQEAQPAPEAEASDCDETSPANATTGAWPNWSRRGADAHVVVATAEATDRNASLPSVTELRATAVALEANANRLEELELYGQADALRHLAQRLRQDARQYASEGSPPTGGEPSAGPLPIDPPFEGQPSPNGASHQSTPVVTANQGGITGSQSLAGGDDERSVLVEPASK